jgi:hypothetical protein
MHALLHASRTPHARYTHAQVPQSGLWNCGQGVVDQWWTYVLEQFVIAWIDLHLYFYLSLICPRLLSSPHKSQEPLKSSPSSSFCRQHNRRTFPAKLMLLRSTQRPDGPGSGRRHHYSNRWIGGLSRGVHGALQTLHSGSQG